MRIPLRNNGSLAFPCPVFSASRLFVTAYYASVSPHHSLGLLSSISAGFGKKSGPGLLYLNTSGTNGKRFTNNYYLRVFDEERRRLASGQMFTELLQYIRSVGATYCHQFGLHCATHQIRIILVSGVVITALFYPALDLYYSSSATLPYLSLAYVFSSASTPTSVPLSSKISDLHNIWSPYTSTFRIQDDALTRARCRHEPSVRMERVLVQSSMVDDSSDGLLNSNILLETFGIEQRLQKELADSNSPCVKNDDGECLVISPLVFWDYDLSSLRSEVATFDTLNTSDNVTVSGVLVSPQMVLAGRGILEDSGVSPYDHYDFDYAEYVVLTYFFRESDCLGNSEHSAWRVALDAAAGNSADVNSQPTDPELIALQYEPSQKPFKSKYSILSTLIYFAYTSFFAYVTWSMRRMRRVHSRIGLTFTALVEITVSTITSLSVCALVGFKVTMVPWELLPIVIVFVGAENMFNLVDAVTKTSTTLTVKDRIAEGLAIAGTSNTLKVVSYNAILGVIAVFSFGAIRQFCIFAIVVLVAHWFLAHTFFLAVLSIDIQRLGLDELLRQGTGLSPAAESSSDERKKPAPKTRWQSIVSHIQGALRGRARTNLSLFLLLAITAALYFATYPSSAPRVSVSSAPRQAKALARNREGISQVQTSHASPAYALWHVLNPSGDPLLHLRIESPAVISLKPAFSDSGPEPGSTIKRTPVENVRRGKLRFSWKSLLWFLKIVVLPITASISTLYLLLLYLLKDAELLEAQRHRAEASPSKSKDDLKSLDGQISFGTLPRGVEADIDIVAATKDGRLIVCVSVRSELVVWWKPSSLGLDENDHELGREDDWRYSLIDTTDLMLRSKATSGSRSQVLITCAVIESQGKYFAVGTSTGVIGVWEIHRSSTTPIVDIRPLSHLSITSGSSAVASMAFVNNASQSSRVVPTLLSIHEDARVLEWSISPSPHAAYIKPESDGAISKTLFTHIYPDDRILVAFCMDDGCTELVEVGTSYPLIPTAVVLHGDAADLVSIMHASRLEIGGSSRLVVGTATTSGLLSLWDGASGLSIVTYDTLHGSLNNLRISPISPERCEICSEVAPESFSVTFSVGQIVQFFKVHLPPDANHRCSCSRSQLHRMSSWDNLRLGHRSRSSSVSSSSGNLATLASGIRSNAGSPLQTRTRLASAYDTAPFPVSGHGVHSRKASEKDKDSSRRMSDVLSVPIPFEDFDSKVAADGSSLATTPPAFSWQGATLVRAFADIMCERGGWDVLDGRIAGVRRRARQQNMSGTTTSSPANSPTLSGLSPATLERWEVWVLDPSHSNLRSSPLVALATPARHPSDPDGQTPRLPFTRVSPYISIRSYSLAGFGNTLGVLDFSSICC